MGDDGWLEIADRVLTSRFQATRLVRQDPDLKVAGSFAGRHVAHAKPGQFRRILTPPAMEGRRAGWLSGPNARPGQGGERRSLFAALCRVPGVVMLTRYHALPAKCACQSASRGVFEEALGVATIHTEREALEP